MKKTLLLFVVTSLYSATAFTQQNTEKIAANFDINWTEHQLPTSSFLIYQGKNESHFIDSLGERVPNHSYLSIKTGGMHNFIVEDETGFHILDTKLKRVTDKPYDDIKMNSRIEIELTSEGKTSYYAWTHKSDIYAFTDEPTLPYPGYSREKRVYNLELGNVNDSRFKSKRIEQLRIGIDMSQTLTVGQKGKNVLVLKDDKVVFKGPKKPMLFYDFMITGSKAPHSIYHPISKNPILENCDRFWCVGSFLIVSVKGNSQKYIVSNTGDIILSSAGEIRYYDYEFGGNQYAFFCDGRSVVNLNGETIYHSDGELIGVAEHYIYAGNSGGFLGNLSGEIELNCTNFERYGMLTVGQIGRNNWRLFDAKSVMINSFDDYFIDETDSVLVCTEASKTMVVNAFSGELSNTYNVNVRALMPRNESYWKYFALKKDTSDVVLEGRFDPRDGIIVEPKYRKIEWPKAENYYVVLTKDGSIRYLDGEGEELFD